MGYITVITPIAPYHANLADEARGSVERQTFPAVWLPIADIQSNGPAWARNQGVRQSTTPYLFFLDADDILEPDALLHAVERHEKDRYTYGDWIHFEKGVQVMPDCYRYDTKSHVISVLMHRDVFKAIGGFNERIDFEDTEFFLRAMSRGFCGVHSPHPFIQYRPLGKRSVEAKGSPARNRFFRELVERYKSVANCCGDAEPIGVANEQQPGDVLVEAQWLGNKITQSAIDGREYPRTGNGKLLWVSAQDAAKGYLMAGGNHAPIKPTYVAPVEPTPDFEALKARLREMQGNA